jgi:hypothetical protein
MLTPAARRDAPPEEGGGIWVFNMKAAWPFCHVC